MSTEDQNKDKSQSQSESSSSTSQNTSEISNDKENNNNDKYDVHVGDENYDESIKLADQFKEEGNNFLKNNQYEQAITKYTAAINLKIETKKNAIYYSNRASANLKLENYGSAIEDANSSLKSDPTFYKAYYRRASAYLNLLKLDEAIADFQFLLGKIPGADSDLKSKIDTTRKLKKKRQFFEAFSSEGRGKASLKEIFDSIKVESTYTGPKFPENGKIDADWVKTLIQYFKDGKVLDKKYMLGMIMFGKAYLEKQPSLINIDFPDKDMTVVGDIHGQFYDLVNIFDINGYPSESMPYLFNGDFVDRGVWGIECVLTLLAYKICFPNHFFFSRGNHEDRTINSMYGFKNQVTSKYAEDKYYDCFVELFHSLPLAHVINNKILVLHGGLFSRDGVKLDEIRKINRFQAVPTSGLMHELLWSDPCREPGRHPSKRGVGENFGPDVAEAFLKDNNLDLLIRSHEMKMEGYEIEPCGKVVTVFSAPNYCGAMGNKGAYVKIKGTNVEYKTFEATNHPGDSPMKYMNPMMNFGM